MMRQGARNFTLAHERREKTRRLRKGLMGHGLSLVTSRRRILWIRLLSIPFTCRPQLQARPEPGLHRRLKNLNLYQPQGQRRESAKHPLLTLRRRILQVCLLNSPFACQPQFHTQPEPGLHSRSKALSLYRPSGQKRESTNGPAPAAQRPPKSVLLRHNTKTLLNNTSQRTRPI